MAVLLIAGFMNLIDVTIVNVALPSMQQAFSATSSQIQWVVAAYILAFALGLLPAGRLGDIIGRREMFIAGVAVFTLGLNLLGLCNLKAALGSALKCQSLRVGDVLRHPVEKRQHIVEGVSEVQLVAVLLHIPQVGRAEYTWVAQQWMGRVE